MLSIRYWIELVLRKAKPNKQTMFPHFDEIIVPLPLQKYAHDVPSQTGKLCAQLWTCYAALLKYRVIKPTDDDSCGAFDCHNVVNGAGCLLKLIINKSSDKSWLRSKDLIGLLDGRYLLCSCLIISAKFQSDDGFIFVKHVLGIIYRTAFVNTPKLSSIEFDNAHLHDILMQIEFELLCKYSSVLFKTLFYTPAGDAELLMERYSCTLDAKSMNILRNLTAFFCLSNMFLMDDNNKNSGKYRNSVDGMVCVCIAVACIDAATYLYKPVMLRSTHFPHLFRNALTEAHAQALTLLSAVVAVAASKESLPNLPNLSAARQCPLCCEYLSDEVLSHAARFCVYTL
jgi:hypothetical protein